MAVWAAVGGGVAVLAAAAGSRAVGQRWALRGRGDAAPRCGRPANPGIALKTTRYLKKFRLIPRYSG